MERVPIPVKESIEEPSAKVHIQYQQSLAIFGPLIDFSSFVKQFNTL